MSRDFAPFLWLLKLGAPLNLFLLWNTLSLPESGVSAQLLIPAQIFLGVSAFRCLFPVYYKDNVVLHDTPLSSIFLTRTLATLSEVAYIYQFSHVLRVLDTADLVWVDLLSWVMVVQVVVSQFCVWGAILSGRLSLYFWEELGWAIIFAANTIASVLLVTTVDTLGDAALLIHLNLLFGMVYLPWQMIHLRHLRRDARRRADATKAAPVTRARLADGLRRSIHERKPTRDADAWSGWVGLTWMVSYWATLIPLWVHQVVVVFAH